MRLDALDQEATKVLQKASRIRRAATAGEQRSAHPALGVDRLGVGPCNQSKAPDEQAGVSS
jgi:hypothetical protein